MEKRMDSIDLTPKQHSEVKALLKRHLPNVEVWAYGSRVTFKTRHNSDLDLVAFVDKERRSAPHRLREAFEESYLPFSVDVLVWDDIPDRFKPNIRRAYYVLQERPLRQIPNSKKQMKLIDFAELNPKVEIRKGEPYPFLEMKDINPQARYISTTKTKAYKGSGAKFMPGDTLFARITPCLENGKISQYRGAPNAPAWGSTEFIVLRGKQGVSDTNFVYYLSQFSEFRDFAIKQMEGTSGRQRVAHSAIAKFSYEFPSLVKQKAIAHVLGLLDDKIEHNHKVSETLEETAKAIFQSWFVDFAPVRAKMEGRPTGLSPEINALFPEKLTQSKIGELPKGWSEGNMLSLCEKIADKFKSKEDWASEKLIDLGRMPIKSITLDQYGRGDELSTSVCQFKKYDFLFGSIRPYFYKAGIAPFDGVTNTSVFVMRPLSPAKREFLYCYASLKETFEKSIIFSKGTKMPIIGWEDFSNFRFPMPTDDIMLAFSKLTASFFEKIILNNEANQTLSELRDALLPKLLSGELHIADAEKLIKKTGI